MANADQECFVYVVLPGQTNFVTAGRFALRRNRSGDPVGRFVYGRSTRQRPDAVELDPVELRLRAEQFQTARRRDSSGPYATRCTISGADSEHGCDRLAGSFLYGGLFLSFMLPRSARDRASNLGR